MALLAWTLRDTSFPELLRQVRAAHAVPLALAVIVATLTFPLRLVRWRLLLRQDNGGSLPAAPLWHALAMGFMANNVLPFRAGEVIRCYAAAQLANTRLTAAAASVAVERVFDALTIVALLGVALFTTQLPATLAIGGVHVSVAHAATTAGVVSVLALLGALAVVAWPALADRVIRATVPSTRVADRLVSIIDGVRHGLTTLRSPRRLAGVVAWSLLIWLVNAAAFWIAFAAFDLPVDFAGALLLQGLLVFGIAIPSTPGFVGVFEAVIGAVLLLYGVSPTLAAAYALVYHFTTFVPITVLGLWSLVHTRLSLGDLRRPAPV